MVKQMVYISLLDAIYTHILDTIAKIQIAAPLIFHENEQKQQYKWL